MAVAGLLDPASSGTQAKVTETSGSTVRTTTTTYDSSARPTSTSISVTPTADGGTAVPNTTTNYDPATGDITSITAGSDTISIGTNDLAQQISYTDADGSITTQTYDADGNVLTRSDGKGTYAYTYDSTDSSGQIEHRGLITALDTGMTGYANPTTAADGHTFTGSYDAGGNLAQQLYPNGLVANWSYDNTGDAHKLDYVLGSALIYHDETTTDAHGLTAVHMSSNSRQDYDYDNAGRLVTVRDRSGGQCTTRQYTFNANSFRTGLTTTPPADVDGACQTSAGSTTQAWAGDDADRVTTTGYTYDTLGRTLTVPASELTNGDTGGAANIGYYANDMVRTQTQGTQTKTFALDPNRRLRTTTDATSGTTTRTLTNHYTAVGDAPTWIATTTGTTTSWQRNVASLTGGLGAIQADSGIPTLQLTNLHSDAIATMEDNTAATSTLATYDTTEYGAPRTAAPARYGWLGGRARSSDSAAGLVLMGARLYNPETGRFLSMDPVPGGNANIYAYPVNPIDQFDLDGRQTYARYKAYLCHGWGARPCRWLRTRYVRQLGRKTRSNAKFFGATCGRVYDMFECWNAPRWLYARGGTTIGNTLFTRSRAYITPSLIRHEREHRHQWYLFGEIFPVLYAREGTNACHNYFEAKAGWSDGNYSC